MSKVEHGRFLVAGGAIIEHKNTGKILMMHRSPKKDFEAGVWEYITGRFNQHEEPEEGLRREVREETGLDIEIIKPIAIFHFYRGEERAENELVGITWWCKSESDKVQMSWEHTEYKWLSPQEALEFAEHSGIKKDLATFIKEKENFIK